MDNEPTDAIGNRLRPAAAATNPWQPWERWANSVEARLRTVVDQAGDIQRQLRTVLDQTVDALEKLAVRSKEQREARELFAASCQQAFDQLEARIIALETGGGRSTPALTEAEFGAMRARLRATLAVGLNELAAARLGDKNRPAAANERAGNMPRLTGEAIGTVTVRPPNEH